MTEFEDYLDRLARAQEAKAAAEMRSARQKILVSSGVLMNWLGDFLGNPEIKWELRKLSLEQLLLTGTEPEMNQVFIEQAERQPGKLRQLLLGDASLAERVNSWVGQVTDESILVRDDEGKSGKYKVLDGMHRVVKAVMAGQVEIEAYVPINATEVRPVVEPHVIYDLIRGYWRGTRDELGREQLYQALRLMVRAYDNTAELLRTRFSADWVGENDIQEVIVRVLAER